jgi:predicted phosphodiesterase
MTQPSIFFCGDPHGSFRHIVDAVRRHGPKAVVLLGDQTPLSPLVEELEMVLNETEIWFIHGNHDTDEPRFWENLHAGAMGDRNIHGRIVEVAGVRIAGVGGVFRPATWYPPHEPLMDDFDAVVRDGLGVQAEDDRARAEHLLRYRSSIFPADLQALQREDEKADVLVTHEGLSVYRHGFSILAQLGRGLGVSAAFHGHLHTDVTYDVDEIGYRAHGVGMCGIRALSGELIRAGEMRAPAPELHS